MDAKEHWNAIHAATPPDAVSWCQHHAELSLRMIGDTRVGRSASIIDVGGGASTLVDDLVANGYDNVTVLDLSDSALDAARKRLGEARAQCVRWIEGDITKTVLPADAFDVWHDRAVFHFLTTSGDRAAYVRAVLRSVKVGGHVIVATFAEDGPDRCSGLPVVRYGPDTLHAQFGDAFTLLSHEREAHHTPNGMVQQFVYCYCRKAAAIGIESEETPA